MIRSFLIKTSKTLGPVTNPRDTYNTLIMFYYFFLTDSDLFLVNICAVVSTSAEIASSVL